MNVIGYKNDDGFRMKEWLSMLESRKNYNTFRKSLGEQEQTIAELDKRVYDYHLTNYIQPGVAA